MNDHQILKPKPNTQVEQTPAFVGARTLFVTPEVTDPGAFQFKWTVRWCCMLDMCVCG